MIKIDFDDDDIDNNDEIGDNNNVDEIDNGVLYEFTECKGPNFQIPATAISMHLVWFTSALRLR